MVSQKQKNHEFLKNFYRNKVTEKIIANGDIIILEYNAKYPPKIKIMRGE